MAAPHKTHAQSSLQQPAGAKQGPPKLDVTSWIMRAMATSPHAEQPTTPTKESGISPPHSSILRSQDSYEEELDNGAGCLLPQGFAVGSQQSQPPQVVEQQQQQETQQQHTQQQQQQQQQQHHPKVQHHHQAQHQQAAHWTASSQAVAVVAACLAWVCVSSGAILVNKHIMVDLSFHFPAAVAALGMAGTTAAAFLSCRVLRLVPCRAHVSPYFFFTRILTTGFFMALSFQAGNTAYLYLSVAFVQMLKAFTPVSTMLVGFAFGLERPTCRLIAAVGCICAGVVVSSYGELNFSVYGVAAMLTSIAAEGLRTCMMQQLLATKQFHPLEAWLYLGPACGVWLLLLIGVCEAQAMLDSHALGAVLAHPWHFGAAAAAGFAVNGLAMLVISLASALTLKVLGICKDLGLVALGVLALGESVAPLQVAGYGVSLLGFAGYNALKAMSMRLPQQAASPHHHHHKGQQQQGQQQGQQQRKGGCCGAKGKAGEQMAWAAGRSHGSVVLKLTALPAGPGRSSSSSRGSTSSSSSLIGTHTSHTQEDLSEPLLLHVVVPSGLKRV